MPQPQDKKIILASASPRRKMLLDNIGLTFDIIPSNVDESGYYNLPPEESVKILSLKKAEDIAYNIDYPAIVIGSDTTVAIDNLSLGKPESFEDAFRMLKLLSGRYHKVLSGIAIIDNTTRKTVIDCVCSEVLFKELTDDEIATYIKTGEPMDKAGSYAIQGIASLFIKGISGCYNNIVGLPVFRLTEILKDFGINIIEIHKNKD
jgi:septum formation protein